jgi:hypothetical protein
MTAKRKLCQFVGEKERTQIKKIIVQKWENAKESTLEPQKTRKETYMKEGKWWSMLKTGKILE